MGNMKALLRLMGAVMLTTVAVNSIVACKTATTAPVLNNKYAILLGWYDHDHKSIINQQLKMNNNGCKEKYVIKVDDAKITKTNFKKSLLNINVIGKQKQALNADAAAFLKYLGFISGNESKNYSNSDIVAISKLFAKVRTIKPGNIEANGTTDFKISAGTCQIDIMESSTNGNIVNSYTINTANNNKLNVLKMVISILIDNKNDLNLTADEGFKQGQPVSAFKLAIKSENKQYQFDSLIKLLKTKVITQFYIIADTNRSLITGKFSNVSVYLTIYFGEVAVLPKIDCGIPTA